MSNYFIWRSRYVEGTCVLTAAKKIVKGFQLQRGMSRKENWPVDVTCEMSQEFPKDIGLSDNLHGSGNFVISQRLRDFMTEYGVANVEYLPVQIFNHKKRLASKDYFILNPLSVIDCIDVDASEVEWSVIRTDFIEACERLVVQDSLVPADVHVFRPKHLEAYVFVRSELVDALKAAAFQDLLFTRAEDFQGA